MRRFEAIRTDLAALKPQLTEAYPIDELGVFGSYVREEHRPDSVWISSSRSKSR